MKEISEWIYPVSLDYRKTWQEWEAIREIVQNMMDTDSDFQIIKREDGLLFRDAGAGLKKRHLLLGVSEKSENARGQFGEGLKFAILVLKRLGYDVRIKSKDLFITTGVQEIEGQKCLKLYLNESPNNIVRGTLLFIKGYHGPTFNDRFVRGNKHIVHENKAGQIIDEDVSRLYVKDIYVCDLDSKWSYNLPKLNLSEDRNIPSDYSLRDNMGRVFAQCTDKEIMKQLFEAIGDEKYEENIDIWLKHIDDEESWDKAFHEYFGENAVLYTNDAWEREAKWRGATVIRLPKDILRALDDFIKTDRQYVIDQNPTEIVIVENDKLDSLAKRNLRTLRALAKKVSDTTKVEIALIDTPASYNTKEDIIYINVEKSNDLLNCIKSLVHELAHTYGADDMTEEMVHMMGHVAGELIYEIMVETNYEETI